MKKLIYTGVSLVAILLFTQVCAAKDAEASILKYLNAGVSYQRDYLGKDLISLDYSIHKYGFYIQSKSGTGFFYNKTDNKVTRDSATKKWRTEIHNEESGFQFGKRLPFPGLSMKVGFSHREFEIDPFNEYVYQGTCQPCIQKPGFTDTYSNPYYLNVDWNAPGPWKFGANYRVEKLSMITTSKRSIRTAVYGVDVVREFKKIDLELKMKKYSPNEQPHNIWDLGDNTLYEFGLTYTPVRFVNVRFAAGMYTNGLPVAGGVFSDMGEMFAFQYLGAEAQFKDAYEEKAGYFTLGVEFSLR